MNGPDGGHAALNQSLIGASRHHIQPFGIDPHVGVAKLANIIVDDAHGSIAAKGISTGEDTAMPTIREEKYGDIFNG